MNRPARKAPSVAVIGGGASGLTFSWLACDQLDIVVYERAREVGGNWRTIEVDGQVVEMGAVKVFEHNRYLRRMCALLSMELTVDDVIPDGVLPPAGTFRIDYPHVRSRAAALGMKSVSFAYLLSYMALYEGLALARQVAPRPVGALELKHVERISGLRLWPRTVRETLRAFLWMGALTYEEIDRSAFMGLMANVTNNFAGFGRHRIYNIAAGFQELARTMQAATPRARFECDADVQRVSRADDGKLEVCWSRGGVERRERFDRVVFACPPWRAVAMLDVAGCEGVRARLERFVNAPNKVSLHDDDAIVQGEGVVQLTVNDRAFFASLRTGVRKLWKSYQSHPTPSRFEHPRPQHIAHEVVFDTDAFRAVDVVEQMNGDDVQGVEGTYYIHNAYHPSLVRNGEQAIELAIALCERLCPNSARLEALRAPPP